LSSVDPGEWMLIDPGSGEATKVAAKCQAPASGAILVPAARYRSLTDLMAAIDAAFPKTLPGPVGGQPRQRDFLRDFDRNNDGVVTPDEFTGPRQVFRRLDTNGDGKVDRDEGARDRPPQR